MQAFQHKELGDNILAYRQAIFKLNHTARRSRKLAAKNCKAGEHCGMLVLAVGLHVS